MNRTPLAWKNLTYDKWRLFVAGCGIAFAVVLMFQQRGFQHALFDSTVEIVRELDCDLVLLRPNRFALSVETRFDRHLLDVAASHEGVAAARPLYIENLAARLRRDQQRAQPIRVLGFHLGDPIFLDRDGELVPQLAALTAPATALMDRLSRAEYGFDFSSSAQWPQTGELNGRQLAVEGTFRSGRDFAHNGNLLMSAENFATYFRHRGPDPLGQVDLGLVKVAAGYSHEQVRDRLQASFGAEIDVLTRQALIEREMAMWDRNTPIGVIFTVGTLMGFVVGVIICYQVLATSITDHLSEFATLKAMGYDNPYFVRLTILQSVYLALLGFGPGLVLSWGLFQFNASYTALPMILTVGRIAFVLVATLAMCILSGLLALRKLFSADPASLF
jgi:putative ABC transport system permease protein